MLVENGDMTLDEYDEYLRGRGDFVKATKKDSSNGRKVSGAAVVDAGAAATLTLRSQCDEIKAPER